MFCSNIGEVNAVIAYLRGRPFVPPAVLSCEEAGCAGACVGGHVVGPSVPMFAPRTVLRGAPRPAGAGAGAGGAGGGGAGRDEAAGRAVPAGAPDEPAGGGVDRAKQREAELLFSTSPPPGPVPLFDEIESLLARAEATVAAAAAAAVAASAASAVTSTAMHAPSGTDITVDTTQLLSPGPERRSSRAGTASSRKIKTKKVVFKLEQDDSPSFGFARASVPDKLTALVPSLLSQSINVRSLGAAAAKARPKAGLYLTMYLPNHTPFHITVPLTATVEEVVQETIREHRKDAGVAAGLSPHLPSHNSRCYELRLPDGDRVGYPDDDVPALDRNRKIKGFSSDLEFCLCVIPGAIERLDADAASSDEIRIMLPSTLHPNPVQFPVTADTTVRDVMHSLAEKYRLALWVGYSQYSLRVSASDVARLKRTSADLALDVIVTSLGVEQLELVKRVYSDVSDLPSPALAVPTGRGRRVGPGGDAWAGAGVGDVGGEERAGEGAAGRDVDLAAIGAAASGIPQVNSGPIIYTIVTAARYEEWEVVKVNKRGRRQLRVLGIDLTRVLNKKVEKKRFGSSETYRAARLVSDITRVEYWEHGLEFFISYRESAVEDVVVEYEAKSQVDRAAIVNKLEFLLGLEDNARLVVRKNAGV